MGNGILIAEDAAFMRMSLKRMLVKAGCEVAGEAVNGKEAVRLYKELKPALVFMDITMPEMDGIEASRQILQEDPAAVVILMSAMGQQNAIAEAIGFGVKDYIIKPYSEDRVRGAVARFL